MVLEIKRYFSEDNQYPYDAFEWTSSDVDIKDENNKVIFTQRDVLFPDRFSQNAKSIVASKYFYGEIGGVERESSLIDLVGRVSETYGAWAVKQGYFDEDNAKSFRDELAILATGQYFAFNSPVWFNVGTHKYESRKSSDERRMYVIDENGNVARAQKGEDHNYPQTSACFIQSVNDDMESIMELARNEAMLFKFGSGTGTDLSTLRSSHEKLSGGGKPSGPLSFMRIYDQVANVVKSGGKTRRAAKMQSLQVWHPDILEFITAKAKEERKIRILIEEGISPEDAVATAAYQNANVSVRVSDAFMKAVENDWMWKTIPVRNKEIADDMPEYKAKKLMELIAEGTHQCGDPGLQFDDTINRWHTCPNTGRINASNPCSEYMFLDDSSCNLASINLMKFRKEDGSFDVDGFENAVETITYAMDLNFDNSSYPSERIAENSHKYRPLGLGYANLGALIMSSGLAYDSDEARALAASITALMTGKTYETSTKIAEEVGAFEGYEKNREPMMSVMRMHQKAMDDIDRSKIPKGLEEILERAEEVWSSVIERGEKHGFRNSQASVLAPTGTIAFMMDCDTTGIEPDLALVKYKQLVGGGTLKIVNETVPIALEKLGYNGDAIRRIVEHINEHDTIEGSELKNEHLSIFDCSFKPANGKRAIEYTGHIDMMAAVQPFISGAISKTVNMPADSSEEEIYNAYMDAWKKGLKSIAIYREGTKARQPLSAGKGKLEKMVSPEPAKRVKLPNTRDSVTHKFCIDGHDGYITVGKYPNGKPGEVFMTMGKEGGTLGGLMDSFGSAISVALQHGVPLETFVKKFSGMTFEPNGWVQEGDKENIKSAKSIMDYIFRWLGNNFIEEAKKQELKNGHTFENIEKHPCKAPRGEKADTFCIYCGNLSSTFKLGSCDILCDENFGGCGGVEKKGCSG
jgi:ribonucleoside-diphosphate reductase alpha chain